jgi:hypothetical protein
MLLLYLFRIIISSFSIHLYFDRRVYNVKGPHHLWHHDGHHKRIRYGLITHECIDRNTRCIIYLGLRDNNSSATVLRLFRRGVEDFMLPYRVRGDKGGKNVKVAAYMLENRGLGRRSYVAGSSKWNTR